MIHREFLQNQQVVLHQATCLDQKERWPNLHVPQTKPWLLDVAMSVEKYKLWFNVTYGKICSHGILKWSKMYYVSIQLSKSISKICIHTCNYTILYIPILSLVWWFLVPKKQNTHPTICNTCMDPVAKTAAMTWPLGPQVKFPVLQSHSFDPYAACLHWEHQECPQNSKSQGLEPPELGRWWIFFGGEYFLSVCFCLGCTEFTVCFFYVFFPGVFLRSKNNTCLFSKGWQQLWTTKSFSAETPLPPASKLLQNLEGQGDTKLITCLMAVQKSGKLHSPCWGW